MSPPILFSAERSCGRPTGGRRKITAVAHLVHYPFCSQTEKSCGDLAARGRRALAVTSREHHYPFCSQRKKVVESRTAGARGNPRHRRPAPSPFLSGPTQNTSILRVTARDRILGTDSREIRLATFGKSGAPNHAQPVFRKCKKELFGVASRAKGATRVLVSTGIGGQAAGGEVHRGSRDAASALPCGAHAEAFAD